MIEYRVRFEIWDSDDAARPVYKDTTSLTVATLRTIDDKPAFTTLCNILLANVVPEGSTVMERRAMEAPAPTEVPHDVEAAS